MRARHLLSKFLLRKGIAYKGKSTWTKTHKAWLSTLEFEYTDEKLVFSQYLDGITVFEQRRERLDRAIEKRAAAPEFVFIVNALKCLRGIGTITAFSLVVEIGDFSRFPDARSFMSFLGLVPSEDSTGDTTSRGKITRTGNIHVRTLLVEAACHHARRYNSLTTAAFAEATGAPPEIASIANRANRRLHERYLHLKSRHKRPTTANIAIARELAGFVWALARVAL
jgi:transposase